MAGSSVRLKAPNTPTTPPLPRRPPRSIPIGQLTLDVTSSTRTKATTLLEKDILPHHLPTMITNLTPVDASVLTATPFPRLLPVRSVPQTLRRTKHPPGLVRNPSALHRRHRSPGHAQIPPRLSHHPNRSHLPRQPPLTLHALAFPLGTRLKIGIQRKSQFFC